MVTVQLRLACSLQAPIPQNGETHSNNSSAEIDNCLSEFDHCGVGA